MLGCPNWGGSQNAMWGLVAGNQQIEFLCAMLASPNVNKVLLPS